MKDTKIRYLILCGSRTGSTYLCELLESTNRLGTPNEYFNIDKVKDFKKQFGVTDPRKYVHELYWQTKKDNDCIGVKVQDDEYMQMFSCKAHGYYELVTHFIWLRRRDIVLQAISKYKAWETEIWDSTNKVIEVPYSQEGIQKAIDTIKAQDKRHGEFFKNKDCLELWYEDDLVNNPEQTITAILSYFKLPTEELPPLKTRSKIMRTPTSYKWKERFIKETGFIYE